MIEYRNIQNSNAVTDAYSTILREASEYFASQRINMMGNGFEEIISEQSLFDTYVDKLSAGLSAEEAVQIGCILENCKMQIMQEASVAGISPIAALSMPTIRKMWVKVALKNALPTEAVKAPKFVISYMEPYIFGSDGVKHILPAALRDPDNTLAEKKSLTTAPITIPAINKDLFEGLEASKVIGDVIDPVFYVETVTLIKTPAVGETPAVTETIKVHQLLDLRRNVNVQVKSADGTVSDFLFASVNLEEGTLNSNSLSGKVSAITIKGSIAQENNTKTQSVSFDIKTKDVTIGTGAHINAPLPIEWLQDTMALYQIDGALEVVDLMSNVVAQKLDQEIREFLEDSFERSGSPYTGSFNVRPSASFAGSPKDWREELKSVIEHYAIKMKNDTAFTNGIFMIIGNPLDLNLITNVDWTFNSSTDERGGVDVDFNIGAYAGSQRYGLVASLNVPAGKIRMIYLPNTPKQMTYKYYPYTFNVEKGYLDPNRPNVPSIMMTKRHTIEEMTPLSCEITILGNDGSMQDGLPR